MKDRRIEQHPFEFVLKINSNIICQRYFNINNFNPTVLGSIELKELLDTITGLNNSWGTMGIIPNYLKNKSADYLQFFEDNPHLSYKNKDNVIENIWDKDDAYSFEIKINGEVVGVSRFEGNTFPPKIRYKVNLKHQTNIWGEKELNSKGLPIQLDILPRITKDIKKTFSQKSYTKEYMGYSLDYNTKLRAEYAEKYQTLYN